jgi:hypothetical protein
MIHLTPAGRLRKKQDTLELVKEYHANLQRTSLSLKKFLRAKVLCPEDKKILARIACETTKLTALVYKQYQVGAQTGHWPQFPLDPYAQRNPERLLVFRLDGYPHMHPQIKRFMDASAVEYKRILDSNPPDKLSCSIM